MIADDNAKLLVRAKCIKFSDSKIYLFDLSPIWAAGVCWKTALFIYEISWSCPSFQEYSGSQNKLNWKEPGRWDETRFSSHSDIE